MNTELNFKLENFDGPLDLLTSMVYRERIDILKIDILDLINQYISFLNEHIEEITINDATEYLTMASYLLELKSKKVLPSGLIAENNFEYERDKLLQQIIEYKKYKDSVNDLLVLKGRRDKMLSRNKEDLSEYIDASTRTHKLRNLINVENMKKSYLNALLKMRIKSLMKHDLQIKEVSIEEVERQITSILEKHHNTCFTFYDFLNLVDKKLLNYQYAVAIFSAILELAKNERIEISCLDDVVAFKYINNIK